MQSSTPDPTETETSGLETRSPEEIKSDKLTFLKTVAADGGRVKPSSDVSFTTASDCDELISEGFLETYLDAHAGVTAVHVRASKAGRKHLQDLQVAVAESMSRALTKSTFESPEQAIEFLEGQAIISTADLKQVSLFILKAMIPPAEGAEHEPEKIVLAKMNKEKLAEYGVSIGIEFSGEESKAEMVKMIEAKLSA